ncbi:MAG: outer membrane beta-barrel domain-containing protein [Oligoflexia bacterium]|nr:outer membrane beta-barrel domain-containing protein [Oligoflexia bacterium]
MYKCVYFLRFFAIFLCFVSPNIYGQTSYVTPKVIAVQSRPYALSDELTVQAGYLPLDSFTRYIALGMSFTHFFTDFFGWEVVNANYASNISTGLEQELATKFSVASEDKFDVLNYYYTTNLVFTPFYNKNLLFNSSIVYGETSLVAGFGISKFDSGNVNCADFGVVFRFLLGPSTSLKFDIRDYIYFAGNARTNLMIKLGFAYNFGTPEQKLEVSSD